MKNSHCTVFFLVFACFWFLVTQTLKESFIKAIGTGLGFNLQRVEFHLSPEPLRPGSVLRQTKMLLDEEPEEAWIFEVRIVLNWWRGMKCPNRRAALLLLHFCKNMKMCQKDVKCSMRLRIPPALTKKQTPHVSDGSLLNARNQQIDLLDPIILFNGGAHDLWLPPVTHFSHFMVFFNHLPQFLLFWLI